MAPELSTVVNGQELQNLAAQQLISPVVEL